MKALPRLVVLFGLGLSLAASVAARDKWIHARTEHFEMFSCASESESRELLCGLEQFRATVLSIYSLPRLRDPRTTVVVFDSDRQFEPYKPLYNGKPKDVAGYCTGWSDETIIALAGDNPIFVTDEIIFHEYVHLLLAAGDDLPPLWLNEGLAELFSTFTIQKDAVKLGSAKPDHGAIPKEPWSTGGARSNRARTTHSSTLRWRRRGWTESCETCRWITGCRPRSWNSCAAGWIGR